MKRIGLLTSGGDAPGMNAAIRAVIRCANYNNIETVGFVRGFDGILKEDILKLNKRSVSNIINRGGTILKTGRCLEFLTKEGQEKAAKILKKEKVDGLVVIGGDGSYKGALILHKNYGIPVVGVPGSIDNDITGTDFCIGSDTALNTALDCIDKIRDTATSLERIFVVEVMGKTVGYIAMNVAISGGAEEVIVPEMDFDIDKMCQEIKKGHEAGKQSWIIVVAEGKAKAENVASDITKKTNFETRATVLGHIQRGGSPTAQDRILATRLGAASVELLIKGDYGKAVGIANGEINATPLETASVTRPFKHEDFYRLMKIMSS